MKNVLVLFSNSRFLPANVEGERGLRETFEKSTDRRVELYAEFLDASHFGGEAYARTVAMYLREKYASRPPDVIVAGASDALDFLLRNRAQVFPETPVVHMGVSRSRLRRDVVPFTSRATAEFLAGLPTEAVIGRLRALGGDAIVFTPGWFEDGDGRAFTPREAARVVAGAAPASLFLPELAPTEIHLDWGQARRGGIDERDVPAGAVWHFREPSGWEAHRITAIGAVAVFLFQAGLIAALVVERQRRRAAELAEVEQRFKLTHASRLAMAGELIGSIAHEINQPLGAILSNADTADLLLDSGTDRRELLRQILADIRRDDLRASDVIRRLRALLTRNEVERKPYQLEEVLDDVEPLLRAEARRRGVTLLVRPAGTAVTLVGDRIQLQQVLLNLVLNAMDAVADVSGGRRTVVLSVEKVSEGVVIEVRDRGRGIPPEHLPKLFDSFFTTKKSGMGLGLSIARSLVEAQGGRIRAENGPGEGATFRVELPVAEAPGSPESKPE